jgi:hypothetical protein
MLHSRAIVCSLTAAVFLTAAIGEQVKSGLQVGESAGAFNVRNITGQKVSLDYTKDDRGSLCYR